MLSQNLLLVSGLLVQLIDAQEATHVPWLGSSDLLRRNDTPTASCPEQFGNPSMNCDDPACGGQSATAGVCKNNSRSGKPCQCQFGTTGAPVPTSTQVTTTNAAGSTIIGVYGLITIDKYKSLKQEQTLTISQTTTGSDGQPTVAAAAAVIAAGGVAWILGTASDAAGAEILQPPPKPPANEDDPSCPAQKNKCKDCGAAQGIDICLAPNGGCACEPEPQCPANAKPKCTEDGCKGQDGKCTTGGHSGCSCQSCPTGDQQPQCNDEQKCKSKDGKCTVDDNAGCECKENPCPEERYTPFCEFCGDKGSDGKCNGIADKNNLWKGCTCWDSEPNPIPWPQMDESVLKFDPESLPTISPSSYSYGGDDPLKCLDLPFDTANRDDIKKSVTDWCKSADGKTVTKTGDTDVLYKRFSYDYYSYWLGAQYDGESGGNCGDSADVHEINCVSTMFEELDDCNPEDSGFKGAELTDGCVKYHVSLSRSTIDDDPPFKPLPKESADCPVKSDDDVSSVTRTFWKGVSKKFCDDVGDGKSAKKADLRNTDVQTRSIFRRTPPPSSSAFPDWKFHFEWEPKDSGVCVKNCEQAMDAFTTACGNDGQKRTSMIKHGTLDIGCGKYSYSLEGPPKAPVAADPFCWEQQILGYARYLVANTMGWINDGGAAFKEHIKDSCGYSGMGWEIYDSPPYLFLKFTIPASDMSCVEQATKLSDLELATTAPKNEPPILSVTHFALKAGAAIESVAGAEQGADREVQPDQRLARFG
ncbi:hypothetical protein K458DRAFT_490260 [Lentithecium fluviatile CBS 122367]|uniref:Glycoside hydrolase family 18 protein n=1 Tax=Lentithecium fluviatile CBS 122367 TaxID=1168545 RepID=A0A6G1INV2_9PLEO|nr:hypothetical protein K458DRAFT_490260 [Lentithecium fluviatile CBS 122367]